MSNQRLTQQAHRSCVYEIRVEGQLGDWWCDRFDTTLAVTCESDGTTTLVGPLADQAALYGLLIQLRDGGLSLVSLHREERKQRR